MSGSLRSNLGRSASFAYPRRSLAAHVMESNNKTTETEHLHLTRPLKLTYTI
jgi:hypothetical protein